jgi:hypothetical protein
MLGQVGRVGLNASFLIFSISHASISFKTFTAFRPSPSKPQTNHCIPAITLNSNASISLKPTNRQTHKQQQTQTKPNSNASISLKPTIPNQSEKKRERKREKEKERKKEKNPFNRIKPLGATRVRL